MVAWRLMLFCSLLAVVLPRLAQAAIKCPANEEVSRCVCDRYCKTLGTPPICPKNCTGGCACVSGYVRNDAGKCIPEKECPKVCPANEIESPCVCDRYCKTLGTPPICPKNCVAGCACTRGYVRNDQGKCIPEKECPKVCPVNEVESKCVCDRYCKTLGSRPVCPRNCVAGCACADGYVRNDDGKCIPEKECPKVCPVNEVESKCVCDRYCNTLGSRPVCPRFCVAGCACADGYVRNNDGKCISEKECPKVECAQSETNVECINRCNLCPHLPNECIKEECTPGCDCKEGYFRDGQGHCVLERDCKTHDVDCPKNETQVDCVNTCNSCPRLQPQCDKRPCFPGCDCLPKYYRDRQRHCVLEVDCETHDGK